MAKLRDYVSRTRDWDVKWDAKTYASYGGDWRTRQGVLPFEGHIVELEKGSGKIEIRAKEWEPGTGYVTKLSGMRGSVSTCNLLAHRYCGAMVGRAVLDGSAKMSDIFPFDEAALTNAFAEIYDNYETWSGYVFGTSVLATSGVTLSWAEGFMFQIFGGGFLPEVWYLYDVRRTYGKLGLLDNLEVKAADVYLRMATGADESLLQEIKDTMSYLDDEVRTGSDEKGVCLLSPAEYVRRKRFDEIWGTCVPSFRTEEDGPAQDPAGTPAEVTQEQAETCARDCGTLQEQFPDCETCRHEEKAAPEEDTPDILINLPELQEIRQDLGLLTRQVESLRAAIADISSALASQASKRPYRISVTAGEQQKLS